MEIKEVKFCFVNDGSGKGSGVNIISDMGKYLNYLSMSDRIYLITELIMQQAKIITNDILDNEDDVTDSVIENYENELDNLMTAVIQATISAVKNYKNLKLGEDFSSFDFSLSTYKPDEVVQGKVINITDGTLHSGGVTAIDPIQSSFDYFTDAVGCLLENNIDKKEIRQLVDEAVSSIKQNCEHLINGYEKNS